MAVLQDPPKAIDWDYIKALYFQGIGPAEIARKTGVKADTISVRATRHGWTSTLRKTGGPRQEVQITVNEKGEESALSKQSEAVRNALGRDLKRVCDLLETKIPKSIPDALKRQQAIEPLVRNAKTVFGWSEGQSQPAVRISILGSAVIDQAPTPQPAIDVTPPSLPPTEQP